LLESDWAEFFEKKGRLKSKRIVGESELLIQEGLEGVILGLD